MAIKRKSKTVSEESFPQEFDTLVKKAFQLQQISAIYKEGFDAEKKDIIEYLENNDDGVEITTGPGGSIKHTCGTLSYKVTPRYTFDNDVLVDLVQSGELSLLTLLEICKPKATDLKKVLGSKKFDEVVVEVTESESLAMTASSSLKEEIRETFDLGLSPNESEEKAPKEEKPKAEKKAAPKKKAAKKKATKFSKADLDGGESVDAILASAKKVKKAKSRSA